MVALKQVMHLLVANDASLGLEWRDHTLHVGGDFLLIYRHDEKGSDIVFVRAGTHVELFRE